MTWIEWIFWFSFLILFYAFVGYPLLLGVLTIFYRDTTRKTLKGDYVPSIDHLIAAYNEKDVIEDKLQNTIALSYPIDKVNHIFITDGSDDKTADIVSKFHQIIHYHEDERRGKILALRRVLPELKSDILVFSDANAMLNESALDNIAALFMNDKVGAVAGVKRVEADPKNGVEGSGESTYWNYESYIKNCESIICSTVGAVGELYAVKRELFYFPDKSVYVEDLITSLQVVDHNYKVAYCPDAIASESPSANLKEEMKRKVRISARGVKSIPILLKYLNPLKFGWLSLFLFSHKILRWIFTPTAIILLIISSYLTKDIGPIYKLAFLCQLVFYSLSLLGFLLNFSSKSFRLFSFPFYFIFTHICTFLGYQQLISGNTSPLWKKSQRSPL